MKKHNPAARLAIPFLCWPCEVVRRVIGWRYRIHSSYTYTCPRTGRTLTAEEGMFYDSFTAAPNLRREDLGPSRAAQIHDTGWLRGRWDYEHPIHGSVLTFDENNEAFRHVLEEEGHPQWIVELYVWGVSRPFMRRMWEKKHGCDAARSQKENA